MNKKKLSVVMAGAMLATSVAPVLAAETTATEIGLSQKATLKKTIKDKMAEKYLTTNKVLLGSASSASFLDSGVKDLLTETKDASAYGVRLLDKDGKAVDLNAKFGIGTSGDTITYKTSDVDTIFSTAKEAEFKAGMTIEIVERKTTTFHGELIPGNEISEKTAVAKYSNDDIVTNFADTQKALNPTSAEIDTTNAGVFVKEVKAVDTNEDTVNDTIKVTLNTLNDVNDKDSNKTIDLTIKDNKLDGRLPLDKDGNLLDVTNVDDVQKFDHFAEFVTYNVSTVNPTKASTVSAYKIVSDEEDINTTSTVADLYDGFALTAKGTELLSELKNAANKAEEEIGEAIKNPGTSQTYPKSLVQLSSELANNSGVYSFTVTYYNSKKDLPADSQNTDVVGKPSKILTVRSTNKAEITSLYNLLKTGTFNVGIVGGNNRYETAVNVAKANNAELRIADKGNTTDEILNNNIVLVNGRSLVDGLSAAPLAASLNKVGTSKTADLRQAPVLLTEADELPTATKEYIEELAIDLTKKERKDYTVTLVGGESVLSEELVKEIEDMGFTVERLGGDNREETSVEVAEAIVKTGTSEDVFVVGGNGEADAMSISAVAATKKHGASDDKVAPIIVSTVHGLSRDGLKFIEKHAKTGEVTVVGGESVVSAKEYDKIDEITDNKVDRLAGKNRFETNAAVIKKYNKDQATNGIVLVKDGVANKDELVDALSAANYAAKMNAPIVLASKNVSDAQTNALLNANVQKTATVAQVGIGAERTVLETIAGLFGISNVK